MLTTPNERRETWSRLQAAASRLDGEQGEGDLERLLEGVFRVPKVERCPRDGCGSEDVHLIGSINGTKSSRRRWNCRACARQYSWRTYTPFDGRREPPALVARACLWALQGGDRAAVEEELRTAPGVGPVTAASLLDAAESLRPPVADEPEDAARPLWRAVAVGLTIVAAVALAVALAGRQEFTAAGSVRFDSPSELSQETRVGDIEIRVGTTALPGTDVRGVAENLEDVRSHLEGAIRGVLRERTR